MSMLSWRYRGSRCLWWLSGSLTAQSVRAFSSRLHAYGNVVPITPRWPQSIKAENVLGGAAVATRGAIPLSPFYTSRTPWKTIEPRDTAGRGLPVVRLRKYAAAGNIRVARGLGLAWLGDHNRHLAVKTADCGSAGAQWRVFRCDLWWTPTRQATAGAINPQPFSSTRRRR